MGYVILRECVYRQLCGFRVEMKSRSFSNVFSYHRHQTQSQDWSSLTNECVIAKIRLNDNQFFRPIHTSQFHSNRLTILIVIKVLIESGVFLKNISDTHLSWFSIQLFCSFPNGRTLGVERISSNLHFTRIILEWVDFFKTEIWNWNERRTRNWEKQ